MKKLIALCAVTFQLFGPQVAYADLDPCGLLALEANETLTLPLPGSVMQVDRSFGHLPLSFERNDGQVDAEAKFLARGPGYHLFLTPTEAVMVLLESRFCEANRPVGDVSWSENWRCGAEANDACMEATSIAPMPEVLRMRLAGASPSSLIQGEGELRAKVNYFIGNDSSRWRTDVPTFAKVRYQEVYPGIDLVYYGNERQLEYDFIVAPGADPSQIALEFDGVDELRLDGRAWRLGGGCARNGNSLAQAEGLPGI